MKNINIFISCALFLVLPLLSRAQDKEANIALDFKNVDSTYTCEATVTSEGQAVKEVEVKLYVQRLFSLLPVGSAVSTDENGIASFEVPNDIPGGATGVLKVIAKIEDNDIYANTEVQSEVKWGLIVKPEEEKMERSLWGSRSRAPIFFIVFANSIIIAVWGTMLYIVLQVFKIKRLSTANKK